MAKWHITKSTSNVQTKTTRPLVGWLLPKPRDSRACALLMRMEPNFPGVTAQKNIFLK